MNLDKNMIRRSVLESLNKQGFTLDERFRIVADEKSKNAVRRLHRESCASSLTANTAFLQRVYGEVSGYFANGDDVDISGFDPHIVPVTKDNVHADLFRFATCLWSVPVSRGFGRRQRFVVLDRANGKLVGIFALGDPVFNLSTRDNKIGWTSEDRKARLYNVMDVFVLGAVPPYSELLCGKLIALLAVSNEVREFIRSKYSGVSSKISGQKKDSRLVYMTTGSALGRSSIYNRVKYDGKTIYRRLGETKGWGHFHITNGCEKMIEAYLKSIEHPTVTAYNFGQGPNWKIRMLKAGLKAIGLPQQLLMHGVSREIYGIPLADNYKLFLRGVDSDTKLYDYPASEIISFFKKRWFEGRAERVKKYMAVSSEETLSSIRSVVERA